MRTMLDAMKHGEFGGLICWHTDGVPADERSGAAD